MIEYYADDFARFVTTKLKAFHEGISPWCAARRSPWQKRHNVPVDSLTYFTAHWPRFEAMLKLCIDANVVINNQSQICELGSWYPYTSYYWKSRIPLCKVDLFDIITRELEQVSDYDVDGVRLRGFNLCTDPLPDKEYDLVIVSEVLEHLPCDIHTLCKNISGIVKPGGYLLVTYPLGGNNAQGYGNAVEGYDQNHLVEEHIREYTHETTKLFFNDLKLGASVDVQYPAYGLIKVCLYQR